MSNNFQELIEWAKRVGIPQQFWDPQILKKIKQYRETLETGVAKVVSTRILVGEYWRIKAGDIIATSIVGLTPDLDLVQIIVRDVIDESLGIESFIKSPFSLGETLWVDPRNVQIEGENSAEAWKIFKNVKLYKNLEDIPFGELARIRGLLVYIRENTSVACARCHSHNIRDGICQKCGSTDLGEVYTYAIHIYEENSKQPLVIRTKKFAHPQNYFTQFLPGNYVEIIARKQQINGRTAYVFWAMRKLSFEELNAQETTFSTETINNNKQEKTTNISNSSNLSTEQVEENIEVNEDIKDIVDSIVSLIETAAKPINVRSFADQVGVDINLLIKALKAKGLNVQGDLVYPKK